MLFQIPSPIQEINLKINNPYNIRLFISVYNNTFTT